MRAGPLTVVVVDDEDDLRMLASASLDGDPRFRVMGQGANGNDAIRLATETQPDIVLLDLEMPWLHGAEAVPYIRREAPRAVIVLWTVAPDSGRARDALALGASTLIDKATCGIARLPAAVADAYERHTPVGVETT